MLEYLFIFHKESREIIYFTISPGVVFNPAFIDSFKQTIKFKEIELPGAEGDISQATVKGKFVVIRSGRFEYVVLVINKQPDRFTREALHSFGIRFSSRWARELKALYTDLNGDVSIFKQRTAMGGSVADLAEECFHPRAALPGLAEQLARSRQLILLGELLSSKGNKSSKGNIV